MDSESVPLDLEETRFRIVKIMLEEFPELRRRVKEQVEEEDILSSMSHA